MAAEDKEISTDTIEALSGQKELPSAGIPAALRPNARANAAEADAAFDYMQAGHESNQADVLAQEYIEELLQRSVPATYLPLLINVLQAPALPLAVQVGCCTDWGPGCCFEKCVCGLPEPVVPPVR